MATETVELTVVSRISEIPIISSSWELVNEILSNNAVTKHPFETVLNLTAAATDLATTYSAPVVNKLAPVILQIDGIANKTIDLAEEWCPPVFEVTAGEIIEKVKQGPTALSELVVHTFEENKTLATQYVELVDSQFAPIVNIIDSNLPIPHDPVEAPHQYERILLILKLISDTLLSYSSEQFKHLQETNKLVANVVAISEMILAVSQDQVGRVHAISEAWLADFLAHLEKLKELSLSLASQAREKAGIIPYSKPLLDLFDGIAEDITPVISAISAIIIDSTPLPEKIELFRTELTDSLLPALESIKTRLVDFVLMKKSA